VALVVITKGDSGAIAYTRKHFVGVAAASVRVVDTVGAGDAFQAALLNALAATGLLEKAKLSALGQAELIGLLAYAGRAAALACSRRGADLPRATELGPPPRRPIGRGRRRA
jgi:fructokinase